MLIIVPKTVSYLNTQIASFCDQFEGFLGHFGEEGDAYQGTVPDEE